jgi:type IV pilus assembly protein PilC
MKLSLAKLNAALSDLLHPISAAQKIFFIDNLRIILKAGISLVEALRILALQVANPRFQKIITGVKNEIEKGQSLSETLAHYPKILPPIYIKMVNAGEVSGKLEESLLEIVNQMKKNYELNSKIRGAMIYPAVILVAVIGVGIEMIVFVLPKLLDVFKEANLALPLSTRILIFISDFLRRSGWLVLIILTAVAILVAVLYKRQPKFKLFCHGIELRLPIIGQIIKQINLARLALTLNSLLKSGVPIVASFEITANVVGNTLYQEALIKASQKIKGGETIAENLEKYPRLFPPLVTQMILIGDKTGTVETVLKNLSDYYEAEADRIIKNLSTIIEPLLIIFLGLVVGALAVSIISPIYSLNQGV